MKHETTAPDLEKFLDGRTNSNGPGFEYVASPYWHPRKEVRDARAKAAMVCAKALVRQSVTAFSPVVYSTAIQGQEDLQPAEGWYGFVLNFLAAARGLTILEIPGWKHSRGIIMEMGFAQGRGLPVSRMGWHRIRPLLDPETLHAIEGWKD